MLNNLLLVEKELSFNSILKARDCILVEFNGESNHVHLIVPYKPNIVVSSLVANLKATPSNTLWHNYIKVLQKTYWEQQKVLWTGSYFVSSCGGVTIEQLRKYLESQN